MRWIALPAGILVLAVTLLDVFSTLVMPRSSRRRIRLTRLLFLATWRPWRWLGVRMNTLERRERMLAVAAPLFFFILLVSWAGLTVVGYGLVLWSPAFVHGVHGQGAGQFLTSLYFSGSSLFTIGFGDIVATGATRGIVIVEGATGLGLVAVVIAYLPVLYQAFNRREVGVLFLDARAGSPPSGPELLRRTGGDGLAGDLPELFREWERWSADVLETHLSYPLLAYYRSQHTNQSWLAALTTVLDASALVMVGVEGACARQARLTFAMARHAVVDLAQVFRTPPAVPAEDRLPHAVLARLRQELRTAGLPLAEGAVVEGRLAELRRLYEPYAIALSAYLLQPLPAWHQPDRRRDNWETSAWTREEAREDDLSA